MRPVDVKRVEISDPFWSRFQDLVREEMLPYQWAALNDGVEGAEKSFCVHNFRVATCLNGRGSLPEGEDLDFHGFVFQDSDLYKWLEAVSYCLASRPDPELRDLAQRAVRLIAAAQRDDGYIDTCYIIKGMDKALTNLRDDHELYCMGHLIEAACAYHDATGSDELLTVARRFADYVYERLSVIPGCPGHELAEMALVRLYETCGEEKYLDLARLFIDRRGTEPNYFDTEHPESAGGGPDRYAYHQAHRPVREQSEAVGHAVRCMYLCSGMAGVARLTRDRELEDACRRLWHSAVHEKLYITGGVGGTSHGEAFSYPFDLPGDTAYSETCAAVGLVFFARRMLELEPRSEYADIMERALFNTCLAGMALDGRSFFYVNPLEAVPDAVRRDSRLSHVETRRQKWFGCACCPPNLARLLMSLGSYAFTEDEDTLWINLYVGGTVKKTFQNTPVNIHISSNIPENGYVKIVVDMQKSAVFSLALRVPGWTGADGVRLSLPSGVTAETREGYMYLRGLWRGGDTVELKLHMPVQVNTASPMVRECLARAAISRGPLVYCAEEADNGGGLHLYRLDTRRFDGISAGKLDIAGHTVTALRVPAKKLRDGGGGLYRLFSPPDEEDTGLTLIPYYAWANREEGEMRVWIRY